MGTSPSWETFAVYISVPLSLVLQADVNGSFWRIHVVKVDSERLCHLQVAVYYRTPFRCRSICRIVDICVGGQD